MEFCHKIILLQKIDVVLDQQPQYLFSMCCGQWCSAYLVNILGSRAVPEVGSGLSYKSGSNRAPAKIWADFRFLARYSLLLFRLVIRNPANLAQAGFGKIKSSTTLLGRSIGHVLILEADVTVCCWS